MNTTFATNLTTDQIGNNYGDDKVYVWLEKDADGKGTLYSYGCAHKYLVGRNNSHYFVIKGNYDQLRCVAETFTTDSNNLSEFIQIVFDWKNQFSKSWGDSEPDLCEKMNELYVHTSE